MIWHLNQMSLFKPMNNTKIEKEGSIYRHMKELKINEILNKKKFVNLSEEEQSMI